MNALVRMEVDIHFPEKQVIRFGGELWDYRGRSRDKARRYLFENAGGQRCDFASSEIFALQKAGKLEILGAAEAESARRVAEGAKPRPAFAVATEHELGVQEFWLKWIAVWEGANRPPRTVKSIRKLITDAGDEFSDTRRPGARQLIRRIAAWEASHDPADLLPADSCKGNSRDKLPVEHKALFQELFEKHFLVPERPTVVVAHASARQDWNKHYAALPKEERPECPSLSFAYAAKREIDGHTETYCREGAAAANHKYRGVEEGPVVVRHNACWEIDHTVADVIVIDPRTGLAIGRPTITVAIDRATRAIPGFHIGWDAPGVQPVMDCLRKAIQTKEALLAAVPNLRGTWPVFGVPDEIVADNGREFRSKAFKQACAQLSVVVTHCPVLKAWWKGRIERAIKTLIHSTCHIVPGSTFANIFERSKDRVPENVAVCTLAQLNEIMLRFVVDIYHVRRHSTMNDSPLRVWNDSVQTYGMKPLPDPKKLATILSPLYLRRPQRSGIQFEGNWYNSPALVMYRTLKDVPPVVSIKVDPNDITRIWFIDQNNEAQPLVVQPSMRERLKGITLDHHKMARALQRNNAELLAGERGLFESYAIIQHALEDQVRGNGLTNRRKAMRALAKIRARAEAIAFEDARAVDDLPFGGDIIDGVFTEVDEDAAPDQAPEGNGNPAEPQAAEPAAAADQPPEPDAPAKGRRLRAKAETKPRDRVPTAERGAPPPKLPPAQLLVRPEDDEDDLDAAVRGKLTVHREGEG